MSGVLLIDNFLPPGIGSHVVSQDLARGLPSLGWTVLTASQQPNRGRRLLDMCRTAWSCRNAYSVANVAVYSGRAFIWAESVCEVLRAIRKPFILTLHGGELPEFARAWPRRVARLFWNATFVSTPSRYLADSLQRYRDDTRVIPNPVQISAHVPRVREQARPRLVWLRALHPVYQPLMAVQVLAKLRRTHPGASLTMIGPEKTPHIKRQIEAEIDRLHVGGAVELVGAVPKSEVPLRLAEHDIFLNTASVDNTPISVLEAMASGLCVVSTNVGGLPYLLRDGHDALLTPTHDSTAMAEAVNRILSEPALARILSRHARQTAEQSDLGKVLAAWDNVLRAAAARRPI